MSGWYGHHHPCRVYLSRIFLAPPIGWVDLGDKINFFISFSISSPMLNRSNDLANHGFTWTVGEHANHSVTAAPVSVCNCVNEIQTYLSDQKYKLFCSAHHIHSTRNGPRAKMSKPSCRKEPFST